MSEFSLPGDPRRIPFGRRRTVIERYVRRFDLGEVMLWSFRGLLVGAIALLAINLHDIAMHRGLLPQWAAVATEDGPMLPPVERAALRNGTVDPRGTLRTEQSVLNEPLAFEAGPQGVIHATGTIAQGSAQALERFLAEQGDTVSTVVIDSPGGSLDDAMAMGRLVREKGLRTQVLDGGICASSCPLFFAGGVERTAGVRAAIGLHQFYAMSGGSNGVAAALSNAQSTAARIGHHLVAMGVDTALWLHAFDTPPQTLYYLTPQQRAQYRLTTTGTGVVAQTRS